MWTGERSLALALSDPGAFVERKHNAGPEADEAEPLTAWQERAVMNWLTEKNAKLSMPDHDQRMDAARARARWELGDPAWAGVIINAYLDPLADRRRLREERRQ